jgi:hypothetical protein
MAMVFLVVKSSSLDTSKYCAKAHHHGIGQRLSHNSRTVCAICSKFFVDGQTRIKEIFEEFDPDNSGNIDYITWSMMLSPKVG